MIRRASSLALLALVLSACQSDGSSSPSPFPAPRIGPEAELVDLRQAYEQPPEFLRLALDAQQAAILRSSMRDAATLLGSGSFILRPDGAGTGSILEGFCTTLPADGPPAGLVADKDGPTRRLSAYCESVAIAAGGGVNACQLYLNLSHLNGAAFGGADQGALWICNPSCATSTTCEALMDSQGVIACACSSAP